MIPREYFFIVPPQNKQLRRANTVQTV